MITQPQLRPHSMDPSWRKSRIAARIWIRSKAGALTARDRRLRPRLADDVAVTERLLAQAVSCIQAEKRSGVLAD